ncbi:hypothetical protein SCUP234_12106 [Seiridium cupressi]
MLSKDYLFSLVALATATQALPQVQVYNGTALDNNMEVLSPRDAIDNNIEELIKCHKKIRTADWNSLECGGKHWYKESYNWDDAIACWDTCAPFIREGIRNLAESKRCRGYFYTAHCNMGYV